MNGKMRIDSDGTKRWKLNGKLHRLDGPAYEGANGDKGWTLNGVCHRIDGPAYERVDGSKFWYVNGKRHRLDGPAIEWANGDKEWWTNGIELPSEEINQWVEDNNLAIPFNEEAQVLFKLRWL